MNRSWWGVRKKELSRLDAEDMVVVLQDITP